MCTVSWLRRPGGYVLLCNRDERHTRKHARGPKVEERQGVFLISPVDGDYGGSWIGVNQFGITLCLLNRYGDEEVESSHDYVSRGLLLRDLLPSREPKNIQELLDECELESFRPFTLAVVSASEPAMLFHWTGHDRILKPVAEGDVPLVSSSLREPEIETLRKQHFHSLVETQNSEAGIKQLHQFHRSHFPERGPYSVCMHREDAATMSLSAITVTQELIEFAYHGGSPCLEAQVEVARLARMKAKG